MSTGLLDVDTSEGLTELRFLNTGNTTCNESIISIKSKSILVLQTWAKDSREDLVCVLHSEGIANVKIGMMQFFRLIIDIL